MRNWLDILSFPISSLEGGLRWVSAGASLFGERIHHDALRTPPISPLKGTRKVASIFLVPMLCLGTQTRKHCFQIQIWPVLPHPNPSPHPWRMAHYLYATFVKSGGGAA